MTADELNYLAQRITESYPFAAPASPYLDAKEAAAYCHVSLRTLYNNRRHIERLPGLRKLLFTRAALDHWLSCRRKSR